MRPLRLALHGFGPYATEQVIDFEQLGDRRLFLIHGATGAGKTSLLDAICFALFGETSGDDRDARLMRTHHVPRAPTTRAVLDFALGAERYRVLREPEQEREKQRGSGFTRQPARATLWRLGGAPAPGARAAAAARVLEPATGVGESAGAAATALARAHPESATGAESEPIATRWSAVGEEIERLLGFRAAQFRQVVVLPQGRFRELLTASSAEREAILGKLFGTALYRRIEDELRGARIGLAREREKLLVERDAVLRQAGAATLAELRERRAEVGQDIADLEPRIAALRAAQRAAQERHAAARDAQRRLDELAAARDALDALAARTPEIDRRRRDLERARRAARVDGTLRERGAFRAEVARAAEALALADAAESDSADRERTAAARLAAEEARAQDRTAASAEHLRLFALAEPVDELERIRGDLSVALAEEAMRIDAAEAAASALAAGERERSAVAERREALRAIAGSVERRRASLAEIERLGRETIRVDELRATVARLEVELERRRTALAAAEAAHGAAAAELRRLRDRWSAGQAAILAAALAPGNACPVCGATEHPAPAAATEAVPTPESVEARERHVERLVRGVREAATAAADRERALHESRAELDRSTAELGDPAGLAAATADDVAAARRALAEAEAARDEDDRLAVRLAELDAAMASFRDAHGRTATEQRVAEDRRVGLEKRLADVEPRVPPGLDDRAALAAATGRAAARVTQLDRALAAARTAAIEASAALVAARTGRAAAESALAEARAAERAVAERLEREVAAAGFRDESELASATLVPEQIDALERELRAHDEAHAAARDRVARGESEAGGVEPPDLATLAAAAEAAGHALQEAIDARVAAQGRHEPLERGAAEMARIELAVGGTEERYRVVGRVAEVAQGDNPLRLPLHRFVLAALLDDVLDAASRRLLVMSAGRYMLRRSGDPGSRRTTAGLELEVLDGYTGTARPAATLSGGESFLAALALALGLADVVQAYEGGIRLDSIFVDEGFGSLDAEALDLAMRSLADLQRGGRLVGVISHVPELKARITTRLEVEATRSGSRAEFVLG